jgi:Glycosyltransferase family 87/WD40-like Beta Propeller Repeat
VLGYTLLVKTPPGAGSTTFQARIERPLLEWKPSTLAVRLAVLLTLLFFLVTAFRTGWMNPKTDFPNYYTAAKLVRQGQPLRPYYDWTWFARQMNYAGNGTQLGSYIPQTPLTMLPMVTFAGLPPQRGKQVWLSLNLAFLAATIWLLAQVTSFSLETIWLLAFCGYFSLRTNFLYGQYYVFLLFLLTLAFYFLHRDKHVSAGILTGIAFALKLYGGPFLVYFAARRQWRALIGMIVATLGCLGVAILLFGWADTHYYAAQIFPRSLEGGSIDPYTPGTPTVSNLLRHVLVADRNLNPHPLWQAPWLFFFLRPFISFAIIATLFFGISSKQSTERHDFAWFVIGVVLLSTGTASYTFIILLLPLVLLLEESGPRQRLFLVISYILLTLPLHPVWMFPKVWLLFALFLFVGWQSLQEWRLRHALAALAAIVLLSFIDARRQMLSYAQEPAQRSDQTLVQEGEIFSTFPVVTRTGVFYQSMGKDRYVLRWLQEKRSEEVSFEGQALHPRLSPDGESIVFELVADGKSTMMQFNPSIGTASPVAMAVPSDRSSPVVSPDGKWLAFDSAERGPTQITLRDLSTGTQILLTGGNCNNSSPAWELDSKGILFASDCGRGNGLTVLYRTRIPGTHN